MLDPLRGPFFCPERALEPPDERDFEAEENARLCKADEQMDADQDR